MTDQWRRGRDTDQDREHQQPAPEASPASGLSQQTHQQGQQSDQGQPAALSWSEQTEGIGQGADEVGVGLRLQSRLTPRERQVLVGLHVARGVAQGRHVPPHGFERTLQSEGRITEVVQQCMAVDHRLVTVDLDRHRRELVEHCHPVVLGRRVVAQTPGVDTGIERRFESSQPQLIGIGRDGRHGRPLSTLDCRRRFIAALRRRRVGDLGTLLEQDGIDLRCLRPAHRGGEQERQDQGEVAGEAEVALVAHSPSSSKSRAAAVIAPRDTRSPSPYTAASRSSLRRRSASTVSGGRGLSPASPK